MARQRRRELAEEAGSTQSAAGLFISSAAGAVAGGGAIAALAAALASPAPESLKALVTKTLDRWGSASEHETKEASDDLKAFQGYLLAKSTSVAEHLNEVKELKQQVAALLSEMEAAKAAVIRSDQEFQEVTKALTVASKELRKLKRDHNLLSDAIEFKHKGRGAEVLRTYKASDLFKAAEADRPTADDISEDEEGAVRGGGS